MSVMQHPTSKPDEPAEPTTPNYPPNQSPKAGTQATATSMNESEPATDSDPVVALCGSPKSGKTTVATVLDEEFGASVIDVDDHQDMKRLPNEETVVCVDHVRHDEDIKCLQRHFSGDPTVVAVDAPDFDRVERYWSDYEKDNTKPYDANKIKNQFERLNDHFWRSAHSDIAQHADFVMQNGNPYDRSFLVAQCEILMDGLTGNGGEIDSMFTGELK